MNAPKKADQERRARRARNRLAYQARVVRLGFAVLGWFQDPVTHQDYAHLRRPNGEECWVRRKLGC